MQPIRFAIIGGGNRGHVYANYALRYPHDAQVVAVAEPKDERRQEFQTTYGLRAEQCFADWHDLLSQPQLADAVLICTPDRQHFTQALVALEAGYHVLLEKPMSPNPQECLALGARAVEAGRLFAVCHVLRYTAFFSTIKQLLEQGEIGQLVSIQHNENVAYWHQAHSYVRGNWRNSTESSPMILAKSCHDMDILLWLVGTECVRISSFGSLFHFRAENAPPGAPLRCLDGCPVEETCPWYAPRFYLTENTGWPASAISVDMSLASREQALREGPYGRCVYHCDNDVVDHQVVNMEFANGVSASFTMCAFTQECSRVIKLMGTRGEINGHMAHNIIEVHNFASGTFTKIHPKQGDNDGHGGGDFGLIRDFTRLLRQALTNGEQEVPISRSSVATSVQSHLMAFAAERARLEKRVVELSEFQAQAQKIERIKIGK